MSFNIKSAAVAALTYLRDNSGAVAFMVGEGALVLAKLGLNVTTAQLTAGVAVLLPVLLGYFHVAKTASVKAAAVKVEAATGSQVARAGTA